MITAKKIPHDEVVQTLELRGYDSVELWRAVFAHCSELEKFLRDNRRNFKDAEVASIQSRIDRYKAILAKLDVLSNQVD